MVPHRLVAAVCAQTDPFCPHAEGSKIPDTNSAKTLAVTTRAVYTLSTSASGEAALAVSPSLNCSFLPGTIAAGVTTFAANWITSGQNTFWLSAASRYRIVSAGFKIHTIANRMAAQGSYFLKELASGDALTALQNFDTVDNFDLSGTNNVVAPLAADAEKISWVFRTTGTIWQDFQWVSTINPIKANSFTAGYNAALVSVSGGPASTPVAIVEVICHYELMFNLDNNLSVISTRAAGSNPGLLALADEVRASAPPAFVGVVDTASRWITNKATALLKRHAGQAMGAASTYFTGSPALGYAAASTAGLIMDLD